MKLLTTAGVSCRYSEGKTISALSTHTLDFWLDSGGQIHRYRSEVRQEAECPERVYTVRIRKRLRKGRNTREYHWFIFCCVELFCSTSIIFPHYNPISASAFIKIRPRNWVQEPFINRHQGSVKLSHANVLVSRLLLFDSFHYITTTYKLLICSSSLRYNLSVYCETKQHLCWFLRPLRDDLGQRGSHSQWSDVDSTHQLRVAASRFVSTISS